VLAGHGGRVADSLKELAERSDVIITMLPRPPEVEEVVAGRDKLLEGAREDSLILDMSTSSPVLARELSHTARGRGVGMLDAPVSGGDVGALKVRSRSWSAEKRMTSSGRGPGPGLEGRVEPEKVIEVSLQRTSRHRRS
jgi:6-phosphogluconate dehydrogenase-like protein